MSENKKFITNNWHAKLIAVICAVILWFYVGYEKNPITDVTIEIPINYQNLSSEYMQIEKTQNVWVTFNGREDKINMIRAGEVSAVVDLANAEIGSNELPVTINSEFSSYITNIQPANAKTYIDKWDDVTLEIKAEITGELPEGYKQFTPSVSPGTVKVTGPSNYLSDLSYAKVDVDVTGIEESLTKTLPIILVGKNGAEVNNGQLLTNVQNADVYVPIDQEIPSKTVAITPILSGVPASGYKIERVVTEPGTVKISAPADILNKITAIETASIDINGITEDAIHEVSLRLPDGVTFSSEAKVKVFVSLANEESTQTIAYPIEVRGADDNWHVDLSAREAEITLSGNASVISADALKITAYVNVQDLGVGSHEVNISIANSSSLQLLNVNPAVVVVNITEKNADNGSIN